MIDSIVPFETKICELFSAVKIGLILVLLAETSPLIATIPSVVRLPRILDRQKGVEQIGPY